MGKRSNKEALAHRRELQRAKKKQEQQHSLKILIITVSTILLAALLLTGGVFTGSLVYNAYLDSGVGYRGITSYKTEHFKIDNAMLTFYFYDYLYDGILERLGLEHPDELKDQYFTMEDENGKNKEQVSYFTYYIENAAMDFQYDLLYAEAAVNRGVTLDERDRTFISSRLKSFENAASSLGLDVKEYLATRYGRGITLSDIEKVLNITVLADKQYALSYGGQSVSTKEVESYLLSSKQSYIKIDYYLYDLLIPDNATEDQKKAIKERADKLMACETDEEFLAEMRKQFTEDYGTDRDFDEKYLQELVESTLLTESVREITADTDELDSFIHSPDRKAGDSYLAVGKKSYAVIRIAKSRYSVDQPQDELRIIRFDFKNFATKAEGLAAFNALKKELTGKGLDAFLSAAKTENHDRVAAIREGYYLLNSTSSSLATLLSGKLENAKVGDLIEVSNEQSIWLVYYCGKGKTLSEANAEDALRAEKFNKEVDGFADLYEMSYSTSKIYKISPLKKD